MICCKWLSVQLSKLIFQIEILRLCFVTLVSDTGTCRFIALTVRPNNFMTLSISEGLENFSLGLITLLILEPAVNEKAK